MAVPQVDVSHSLLGQIKGGISSKTRSGLCSEAVCMIHARTWLAPYTPEEDGPLKCQVASWSWYYFLLLLRLPLPSLRVALDCAR